MRAWELSPPCDELGEGRHLHSTGTFVATTNFRRRESANDARRPAGAEGADLDLTCIDTIRTLAMDAVQKANSGHPGTPMALAPVAYTLWQEALRYDCDDPKWRNRDRFVLSNGHASMLLYALLHLAAGARPRRGRPPRGQPR